MSESDDLVGDDWVKEVREDSKTVVTSMGRTSEDTHPSFPKHIQMLPQTRRHVEPRRPFQPVLGLRGTKRVSPTTSVSAWVKRAKEAKDSAQRNNQRRKKGEVTLSLKPKASLNPKQKIQPKEPKCRPICKTICLCQMEISRHGCYSETMEVTALPRTSGQESGHG
jgi:hypothetical protein